MKHFVIREHKKIIFETALILLTTLLIVYVDIVVMTRIIEPLLKQHPISWYDFQVFVWGKAILTWHLALMPLAFGSFLIVSIAAKSWRLFLAGNFFFFGGWGDILYYLLQWQWPRETLPWLNDAILIRWTCWVTGTADVTNAGLWIAAGVNLTVAAALLCVIFRKKSN